MTPVPPPCALGLSGEVLSNWQARFLPAPEQRQIAAHISDCAACQQILSGYDRVGTALHQQPLPTLPPERIWRSVQRVIATGDIMRFSARAKIISAASVVAMIGIVTIFAVVLSDFGKKHGVTIRTTPGATATIPLALSPTHSIESSPWIADHSIPFATHFAFSASEPATGFACGFLNGMIRLSVTHDSGASWSQPTATGIVSGGCEVYVNPTDSHELVLTALRCWTNCDLVYEATYRSFDSGATWIKLTPPSGSDPANNVPLGSPTWAGNALFLLVNAASYGNFASQAHLLAVSVNRGALVWSGQQGMLTGISDPQVHLQQGFTLGTTYYVQLGGMFCLQSVCPLAATKNNGATWTRFTPTTIAPNSLVFPAADGKTLLGSTATGYAQSVDGGVTWTPLPDSPGPLSDNPQMSSTPDGTIYIEQISGPSGVPAGIYKLSPGQHIWTYVATEPVFPNSTPHQQFRTWDANGHPLKIWELMSQDGGSIATPTPPVGSSQITWFNAPLCGQVCPGPQSFLVSHSG